MTFKGKVAVVTGAGGEIGAAVVRVLCSRHAQVLAVDGHEAALAPLAGEGIETWVADITEAEDVIGYAARAVTLWGGIDLFFNNADVQGPNSPLSDYPDADFDEVIGGNLRPVFLGLKHVLPQMRDGGAVVNLASDLAVVGAVGRGGYVASKHGVLGLTKVAALECERRQIRVNAVCPGRVRRDSELGGGFETPEEIADLVAFLLSDKGPVHHRPEAFVDLRADGETEPAAPTARDGEPVA